eukprot:6922012-Heterocapsa_arctica.AAC.1
MNAQHIILEVVTEERSRQCFTFGWNHESAKVAWPSPKGTNEQAIEKIQAHRQGSIITSFMIFECSCKVAEEG